MLEVLLYTGAELPRDEVSRLERHIVEAGARRIVTHSGKPPSLSKLLEYNPDVVISGMGERISPMWSFLLVLKRLRLEGREWPKVILAAGSVEGRYVPETGCYDENQWDYIYDSPPYCELYDISLEGLWDWIGPCLAVLELAYLAHTTGERRQWILTDDRMDYGKMTFKHLKYISLSSPAVMCAFEPASSLGKIDSMLEEGSMSSQLQLKSVGEMMRVDKCLLDPKKFGLFVEGRELGFRLWPAVDPDIVIESVETSR